MNLNITMLSHNVPDCKTKMSLSIVVLQLICTILIEIIFICISSFFAT